ncbi:winged helix-turn-helix domain-containing protein [Pseudoxanthomonas suwonensis]|nr:winged helix-turn-helix domain-containing protein [Pseudoxanthomonas suwonensis]
MPQTGPPSLEFEDTVIDFAGHRLLRGGSEQALEPKAFAVLALLAGTPGRVFTRDEILDAVWGHRHVTPGVLNRIMTLLRQALGEDAHHPRLLHTLHGVGYRFDLPAAAAPPPPGPTTTHPAEPVPDAVGPPRRRASDRAMPRTAAQAAFWLLLLVALALAGWRWWPREAPTAATAPTAAGSAEPAAVPTLVVMPLKAIGDDESGRVIADGLSEELIGSLAQIQGLRVIARTSTALAAAESSDPARLIARLGISHLLEGSLQRSGQRLRVRLRLVDAHSGDALWARDFDRDASEVLLLQQEIAEAVAASLALSLNLAATKGKTGDVDWLQRYLAARTLLERRDLPPEQSIEVAESEFRALLRERPDDARARASLALALYLRSVRRPSLASLPTLREEALHEAAIALQLDPSLPEPYMVQGEAACNANEWERCLALQEKADSVGSHQEFADGYAFTLAELGYLDRAEAKLREIIARDPINARPHFILARLLDTRGEHELAHREFEDHRSPNDVYGRWFNAVWRGDHAEALRIAEDEIGATGSPGAYDLLLKPGYVAGSRALIDPALWPQALAATAEFERQTGLLDFIRLLAPDAPEHGAELVRRLGEMRALGYSSWSLLLWTEDLAWLRRDPAFQAYLRDNGILDYWRKHGFPEQCRPHGDGAICE